ncbi:hypothetical protein L228DRAFT_179732 [Xylona heveae TC161]|uniref:Amino acid transporter transmembrane domain-containing protein n=1 Tax=Xylona heveae (strain CBS 132557 / TC161) TaxID=1328760 RepID=A0A165FBY7_XYLHT|nr:hypothetical protein L228DRAFT_179732 [Xylona heveae TC161]KZF20803.1 hypothetical protein L228DRAFT_179732 [Xylona heveae TC161]
MSLAPQALGAVADPRSSVEADNIGSYGNRVLHTLHDPNVTFEEYLHYASVSRAEESELPPAKGPFGNVWRSIFLGKKSKTLEGNPADGSVVNTIEQSPGEKGAREMGEKDTKASDEVNNSFMAPASAVTEEEWKDASRAARTATWGAVFYLITTDILGPFSVPWAFTQLGYGPGIALYTVFGGLAVYTGWQLWKVFIGLDSDRYPLKNYGDMAFRVYGPWARYVCNVLQNFQFFLNVALLIMTYGISIRQLSRLRLCFIVCLIVFTIAGFLLGQIRSLQRFGYVANLAVWLNLLVIFFTMGVVAHSPPNYVAAQQTYGIPPNQPIQHTAGSPAGLTFLDNINGLMQAVFSYGGATLFCELMAEMRKPKDFWKGLVCAEMLIYVCYMLFGLFVYSYQGQYAANPAFQGIDPQSWQDVGNALGVISALIAACMYGNIGIKVLYANVGQELFHGPRLETRKGRFIWTALVPVYWIAAFVIAASVPQISNFSSLVGAACIMQFTYTFPPLLMIGYNTQRDAILPEETFDPVTGRLNRIDGGIKRWLRGYRRRWLQNTWDLVFFLGSCATAVLGIYASVVLLNDGYQHNKGQNVVAFNCVSPVG